MRQSDSVVWWAAGQRSGRLAERGTSALLLSGEAGYRINKASGSVPDGTLAHIWKRGFSLFSLLVPGQLLAQSHGSNRRLSRGVRESFLVSHAPCLPVCLSPSISLFLPLPSPFCPHTSSKSLPSLWMCFTAFGLPQNNYLNPCDLTVWG